MTNHTDAPILIMGQIGNCKYIATIDPVNKIIVISGTNLRKALLRRHSVRRVFHIAKTLVLEHWLFSIFGHWLIVEVQATRGHVLIKKITGMTFFNKRKAIRYKELSELELTLVDPLWDRLKEKAAQTL